MDFFSRVVKTAFIDSEAYSYPPPGKAATATVARADEAPAILLTFWARKIVGEGAEVAVDTRVLAATNRDLSQMQREISARIFYTVESSSQRRRISFEKGHALKISNLLGPGRFADRKTSRFASRPPGQVRCHCLRDLR